MGLTVIVADGGQPRPSFSRALARYHARMASDRRDVYSITRPLRQGDPDSRIDITVSGMHELGTAERVEVLRAVDQLFALSVDGAGTPIAARTPSSSEA